MRVYIESLTMSSQQPPKKKSKQVENKQGTLLSWVKPCKCSDLTYTKKYALTEGQKQSGGGSSAHEHIHQEHTYMQAPAMRQPFLTLNCHKRESPEPNPKN